MLSSITPVDYSKEEFLNAGVIATNWPGWAIPLSHPRFSLSWILILDSSWVGLIRRCFPHTSVFDSATVNVDRLPPTHILAYNGPMANVTVPPAFGSFCLFDWNMRFKRWTGWRIYSQPFSHDKCGGVSSCTGIVKLAILQEMVPIFVLPQSVIGEFPPSSLSSILKHTTSGIDLKAAPRLPLLTTPTVTKVTHGSYHPGGLFPAMEETPFFLIPCVFSSSRWCKRRLDSSERLAVYDVPISIITLLSEQDKRSLLTTCLSPIKCLTAIVEGYFLAGTITRSGWGEVKLSKSKDIVSSDELTASSPSSSVHSEDSIIPGAWLTNEKHNLDERAVKHDEAKIPIHFWNDALSAKLGLPTLSSKQQDALTILRSFVVTKVWRRNITKCFCSYLRCKSCHLERLKAKFKHDDNSVSFSCQSCKHNHLSKVMNKIVDWENGRYKWKEGKGRKRYQVWFHSYRRKSLKEEAKEIEIDIEVGTDCIYRASHATAWNWPRGSSLFFLEMGGI